MYLNAYHFRWFKQGWTRLILSCRIEMLTFSHLWVYALRPHIFPSKIQRKYHHYLLPLHPGHGRPGCSVLISVLRFRIHTSPMLFLMIFSPNTKLWDTLSKGWRHVPLREISHYPDTTWSCASGHYIFLEIPPIVFVYMAFYRQAHENSTQTEPAGHVPGLNEKPYCAFSTLLSLKW